MTPAISVVIPTLNESDYLSKTLESVLRKANQPNSLEVLVIDAGSTDGTLESIKDLQVQTFVEPSFIFKKYKSLNLGLKKAKGDTVVFLDADTELPDAFDTLIYQCLSKPGVVAGAFEFSFSSKSLMLQLLEWLNRLRYRFGQMYYGDQAIFCRRETALKIGGVPEMDLMESAYFCKRLKKEGKLCLVTEAIKTSPRRFNEHGFLKISWFDFTMWLRFILKLPVEQYGKKYWRLNMVEK